MIFTLAEEYEGSLLLFYVFIIFLIVATVRFFFKKQLLYLILCFMVMMDLLDAFVSVVIVFVHTVIKVLFVVCLKISKSITDIRTVGLLCL